MTAARATLLSERFGAMGNLVAEGVWNQLGRPELDRLTLLIRESVQNSWDARSGKHIQYALDSWTLSRAERDAYAMFFHEQPPPPAYVSTSKVVDTIQAIKLWLREPAPRVLTVSDRGTTGLDGPTRADDSSAVEERNFVDFLRNIGQPPGRVQTGGTFGYGKAAFYLASLARTIVVYTRCRYKGRLQSRLTAAALTHNFVHERARFTGRHWWGVSADGGRIVEPFLDSAADDIAKSLGLRGFVGDECGTTIAILAPAFDDGELKELGTTCLRHLWPKLKSRDGGQPPIALSVRVAGVQVPIPDPAKTAPYDAFWRAYCALETPDALPITYRREKVGALALERALILNGGGRSPTAPEHEVRPQHVALLRTPELIVKYLEAGRGFGHDAVGFVGVFRCNPEYDDAFARSEPPTHDDWQPSSVADKRASGIVRTALKHIREACKNFSAKYSPTVEGAQGSPLAKLASDFGLLAGGTVTSPVDASRRGTRTEGSPPSRKSRGEQPRVRTVVPEQGPITEVDGRRYVVFAFEVTHASDSERTRLNADVYPVVAGGAREVEPPKGRTAERTGWWLSPRGARFEGNAVEVGPKQEGVWTLFVPLEPNVALGASVIAERGGEAT